MQKGKLEMIRNFYEIDPAFEEHCHDGEGVIKVTEIYNKFTTKMQFFHYTVLPPGTSIGSHKHEDDEEFYVILEGHGEMEVDGAKKPVSAGDVIMNEPFGTHGLKNTSDSEDLKIMVFEVKQ